MSKTNDAARRDTKPEHETNSVKSDGGGADGAGYPETPESAGQFGFQSGKSSYTSDKSAADKTAGGNSESGARASDKTADDMASGGNTANGKASGDKTSGGNTTNGRASEDNGASDCAKPDQADAETDPVSKLRENLASERDRYLRLAAEYDNFRKRNAKERENTYSDARADAITRLLPVYDNLERALKTECADEAFYKGVEMILTQLTQILEGMDVRPIQAVGNPFDPNLHNALMTVDNPDLGANMVSEEFQKGFTLGQRVIRHSAVIVTN